MVGSRSSRGPGTRMPRASGPTAGALSAPTFPLQFWRLRTLDWGIQAMKLGARTDRSFASLTSSLGSARLPQAGSPTVALSSPLMPLGSFRLPQLGTSSFHQLLAPHEVRSGTVRWGTEVEKGTVSPARAPLPWALRPPFFLYRSISSGPGGGRRDREESKTRWLSNTVPGSYPILPGRNLCPAPDILGAETQSFGKGKLLASLYLGCSCLLLKQ